MALDFINLSCMPEVFWTRSRMSGGGETTESRFLSRISVKEKREERREKEEWLEKVRAHDDIPYQPMDNSVPSPGVFPEQLSMTAIELLIHNPYAFYAKYILGLKIPDDPLRDPGAREFGNIVHETIELLATSDERLEINNIINMLDSKARAILPADSVLFHFWHKRFVDMVPFIAALLQERRATSDERLAGSEVKLNGEIAGRKIYAYADMILGNAVIDIKTGSAPSRAQLIAGNMPQLPLEAFMLQKEQEQGTEISMKFLQLKNRDVKWIEYSGDEAKEMIDNTVQKVSELIGQYTRVDAAYEYRETGDAKYKEYDDLYRK
jgi:ATP-dependent helicase/nuclease subunit B